MIKAMNDFKNKKYKKDLFQFLPCCRANNRQLFCSEFVEEYYRREDVQLIMIDNKNRRLHPSDFSKKKHCAFCLGNLFCCCLAMKCLDWCPCLSQPGSELHPTLQDKLGEEFIIDPVSIDAYSTEFRERQEKHEKHVQDLEKNLGQSEEEKKICMGQGANAFGGLAHASWIR